MSLSLQLSLFLLLSLSSLSLSLTSVSLIKSAEEVCGQQGKKINKQLGEKEKGVYDCVDFVHFSHVLIKVMFQASVHSFLKLAEHAPRISYIPFSLFSIFSSFVNIFVLSHCIQCDLKSCLKCI